MSTKDIEIINTDSYVSANQLFNIQIGSAFNIQVQGTYGIKVHFGSLKPDINTKSYRIVPPMLNELYYVDQGSEELLISGHKGPSIINVEV